MKLLDGSRPRDERHGNLALYRSFSLVQAAGIEWALKQLQDRLDRYSPPLETEEDRDAAFDDWSKHVSEMGTFWSYTISKGNETLVVSAEAIFMSLGDVDGGGQGIAGEEQRR